jgi:hypothetical protein
VLITQRAHMACATIAVVVASLGLAGCAEPVGSSAPTRAHQPTPSPTKAAPLPSPPSSHPPRTSTPRRHHRRRKAPSTRRGRVHRTPHVVGVPRADLPNRHLTPGVALTTRAATVCVSGYASRVRDVPDSEKELAYGRYGVIHLPYQHEVDHLVSLELGGSNAIRNLWPEPYAGRWGARTKDTLENSLHDLVCSGVLTLRHAQHVEAINWVSAYRTYVGAPPASTSHRRSYTHHPAPSTSGSCQPGYSPCLPRVADLDCGQIDDSKKPIHVSGDDPYRLDADGDDLGCDT